MSQLHAEPACSLLAGKMVSVPLEHSVPGRAEGPLLPSASCTHGFFPSTSPAVLGWDP